MLEACGPPPYTGRELLDLQNRFLPALVGAPASQTFQHFQLETHLQKAFLITDQNIFGQKTVEVEREAMSV